LRNGYIRTTMDIAALQVALGTAYRIQRELGRGAE